MKKVLAVDAGGTKLIYTLIDQNGGFLKEASRTSTPKDINELKELFKKIISYYEDEADYIAFATAGSVNLENTKVESSTSNMPCGYNKLDFSDLSAKPVYVENDANAAAWAEYKLGAAMGDDNTIIITLGTGIGGGFIAGGKLLRGKSGRGGEVGSMKINSKKRICTCGRYDCFESYASGTGLRITAEETALCDDIFKSSIHKNKKPSEITTYDIIDGINQNDDYSKKVFNIWKQDLAAGLINIANIFDTESIVLSGGMGRFIDAEEIEDMINNEIVVSPVKVKHAKAGNYSGMIGAALLAFDKFLPKV